MSDTITVVLVDEHRMVRQALAALLAAEGGFAVVGEASDGAQAIELVEALRPDVVVVVLATARQAALDVIRRVAQRKLRTRSLVLSAPADEVQVLAALEGGAGGYVRQDATAADLFDAIREVAAGHRYLSPPFSDQAIEAYRQRATTEAGADLYATLTDREREVLRLMAEGLRNREIGDRLAISPRTAETHRARVMSKLGLRREADVVRYALRRGILPLD